MKPASSHSNPDFNQGSIYFNQELLIPSLHGEDPFDGDFTADFLRESLGNDVSQVQFSENESEDFTQATRLNTDAIESSGPISPYLQGSYTPDYPFQGLLFGQDSRFLQQSGSQTPKESMFSNQEDIIGTEGNDLTEESDEETMNSKSLLESKVWDEKMDTLLLKFGTQFQGDWKKIAKKFHDKKVTPHFVKMRYKELTCGAPIARRNKFTHREDLMIAKYFDKYGSNWARMVVFFPDRTAIMLKNRYYSFMRKRNLTDLLLAKARDLENSGLSVDNLKTYESENYTECMDLRRGLNAHSQENDKELKILKDRVKVLETLYLQAIAELEKYKNKN